MNRRDGKKGIVTRADEQISGSLRKAVSFAGRRGTLSSREYGVPFVIHFHD